MDHIKEYTDHITMDHIIDSWTIKRVCGLERVCGMSMLTKKIVRGPLKESTDHKKLQTI